VNARRRRKKYLFLLIEKDFLFTKSERRIKVIMKELIGRWVFFVFVRENK